MNRAAQPALFNPSVRSLSADLTQNTPLTKLARSVPLMRSSAT